MLLTCGSVYALQTSFAQAHLSRATLPISDYITDTKGVLDNAVRVLQVVRAAQYRLTTTLNGC
jgi:hypothetical protein